jgi:putative tricarboxylic transport membrane protein
MWRFPTLEKEQWTAIGLSLFALVTVHESIKLGIWRHGYPQPGAFPLLLGLFLGVLSVLFFRRFTQREEKRKGWDDVKSQWAEGPGSVAEASSVDWRKVLFSMAAVAAYPLLFATGGFMIGTAIFLFFMCKFVERLKIVPTVIMMIVTIVSCYVLFAILLKVPLPLGPLSNY